MFTVEQLDMVESMVPTKDADDFTERMGWEG